MQIYAPSFIGKSNTYGAVGLRDKDGTSLDRPIQSIVPGGCSVERHWLFRNVSKGGRIWWSGGKKRKVKSEVCWNKEKELKSREVVWEMVGRIHATIAFCFVA